MKAVLQRVAWARVEVEEVAVGEIGRGLLVYLCVEPADRDEDVHQLARKIRELRVFPDRTPMDLDVTQVGGEVLVISQFTLAASLRRGRRPSFTAAAAPDLAEALYDRFCASLTTAGLRVARGRFGTHMQVTSCNDGPVTLEIVVRDGAVV